MAIHPSELRDTWRGCPSYSPCPLDLKCMAYDPSHMVCSKCEAGVWKPCDHEEWERNLMIRRRNFKLKVGDGLLEEIKELEGEITGEGRDKDSPGKSPGDGQT